MKLLLSKNKKDLYLKASLWKIIEDYFRETKNIDVGEYLVSIIRVGNKMIVKSSTPLFKSELLQISDIIKSQFEERVNNLEGEKGEYIIVYR